MTILEARNIFRGHQVATLKRSTLQSYKPLEIISKGLLRHLDLKTTQVYLGKVTD